MSGNSSLYNIAVRMTMVSNHGPILAALAHSLTGIHHQLNQATAASARFRIALIGAGTAFAGTKLVEGMGQLVKHGAEFDRILSRMRLGGWQNDEIGRATAASFNVAKLYPQLSAGFLLETQREMAGPLGSREEATRILGPVAQMIRLLQFQKGATLEALQSEAVSMVRAGELSANTVTDKAFTDFITNIAPAINAFGGLVSPHDLMQVFKYSRAAGMNLSDRFVQRVLPTLIQEMGGSSAGTSFMSQFQAVIGGTMRVRALNEWNRLGLIDRSKVDPHDLTPEGRIKHMQGGLILDSSLFLSDPDKWYAKHLIPSMVARGMITQEQWSAIQAGELRSGPGKVGREAITKELALLYPNRVSQGLADATILQVRKLLRDNGIIGGSATLERSMDILTADPWEAVKGVGGALRTFVDAFSGPSALRSVEFLNALTSGIGKLTDAVRGLGPDNIGMIFEGLAVFGGALTVAGIVGMVGAILALPGAVAAAMVALAGFGAWLAYEHRESIKKWALSAGQWFAQHWLDWPVILAGKVHGVITEGMVRLATMLADGIKSIPDHLGEAIAKMVSGIASMIGAGLSMLWQQQIAPHLPWGGGATPAPGVHPQNWVPPPRQGGGLVPIRNDILIDGHRIGLAVSHYIAVNNTHVLSAAQYDGGLMHVPVDLQFS